MILKWKSNNIIMNKTKYTPSVRKSAILSAQMGLSSGNASGSGIQSTLKSSFQFMNLERKIEKSSF